MRLSDFDYNLPPELIAQHPAVPRDSARLIVVDRRNGQIQHRVFRDLPEYLRPPDVLVINDTRVMPARLRSRKTTGGAVEVLLLRPVSPQAGSAPGDARPSARRTQSKGSVPPTEVWETLVRPGRRVRKGNRLEFAGGLTGEVVDAREEGVRLIAFATDRPILDLVQQIGEVPLPPYVHEPLRRPDDYQTVYARVNGAVAAPTAGLHFTGALLQRIRDSGASIVTLTMHIGLGTFRPVSVEVVERHRMDTEWFEVPEDAAAKINVARAVGGHVVVVGTSAVRALETVTAEGGTVRPGSGWSELFIYPGYRFKATDVLVTNFHLPETTLLMLVCAFAGRELILRAYEEAIRTRYRFYSFGDAMLIL